MHSHYDDDDVRLLHASMPDLRGHHTYRCIRTGVITTMVFVGVATVILQTGVLDVWLREMLRGHYGGPYWTNEPACPRLLAMMALAVVVGSVLLLSPNATRWDISLCVFVPFGLVYCALMLLWIFRPVVRE